MGRVTSDNYNQFLAQVTYLFHFSCDPNLSIFNVWIDCLDPNLPRLCLFANRNISKHEQLTFDYRQRTGYESGKHFKLDIARVLI